MVLFKCGYDFRTFTTYLIYIPLWSYSNLVSDSMPELAAYLHSTMVLFKCGSVNQGGSDGKDLHSTMVLFKSHCYILIIFMNQIYIPLWSYSNRASQPSLLQPHLLFTFHYGPIQMPLVCGQASPFF